jgi:hypothetical protein
MEQIWNHTVRRKPKDTQKKPVPVPLYPPQTPQGANPGLRGKIPATNSLTYDTAMFQGLE